MTKQRVAVHRLTGLDAQLLECATPIMRSGVAHPRDWIDQGPGLARSRPSRYDIGRGYGRPDHTMGADRAPGRPRLLPPVPASARAGRIQRALRRILVRASRRRRVSVRPHAPVRAAPPGPHPGRTAPGERATVGDGLPPGARRPPGGRGRLPGRKDRSGVGRELRDQREQHQAPAAPGGVQEARCSSGLNWRTPLEQNQLGAAPLQGGWRPVRRRLMGMVVSLRVLEGSFS
jgi:hypothetical protein